MSNSSAPQPRHGMSFLGWGLLLVMVIIGYSAVRNLLDWNSYNKGHKAYLQADCTLAIRHFDRVINGWRLADMGKFAARARQQKAECVPFQAAVDRQQAGELRVALLAYLGFMDQYKNSLLANAARDRVRSMFASTDASTLASQETCGMTEALLAQNLIPQPGVYLPPLYLACGQVYDAAEHWQSSSDLYKAILIEYPGHSVAVEAEKLLINNPLSCQESELIRNSILAQRSDFMPSLYMHCGQEYEKNADWANAIAVYENLLVEYPTHALAPEAEVGLARSIVTQSQANSAGEIPAPERSGTTGSQFTEVVIQNDSPERLRIVFRGPVSRVVELEACPACMTYTGDGPAFCPEQGPVGRYTLDPGQYDVVVEASSGSGVTPWTGNWDLISGDQYYSCFFIVNTLLQ